MPARDSVQASLLGDFGRGRIGAIVGIVLQRLAVLSFWGDVYSTQLDENNNSYQETALPAVNWVGTSSDDVQINLSLFQSDETFAAPIGLLDSSLDSGTDDGTTTLPGSLLIGGTGNDWLIGNAGDDTIIGGDPTYTVSGVVDEVLVGGGVIKQNPSACRRLHQCGMRQSHYQRRFGGKRRRTLVGIFLQQMRAPAYRLYLRRQYSGVHSESRYVW